MLRALHLGALVLVLSAGAASPQIGGDGRDGPLTPAQDLVLDTTKDGGRFYFTRVDVPKGIAVRLRGSNPALIHVQGDCRIAGALSADGDPPAGMAPGNGGPGGWRGGKGGVAPEFKADGGEGPGGGQGAHTPDAFKAREFGGGGGHLTEGFQALIAAPGGPAYGAAHPFDLRGGSGGGGGADRFSPQALTGGSGGGGVIVVLCDGAITIEGEVRARGGDVVYADFFPLAAGGGGSGGAVFLRALRGVTVAKGASVLATGGAIRNDYWRVTYRSGADGFVRIDSYGAPPVIEGTLSPAAEAYEIPELREINPPKIGWVFRLRTAALPNDVVGAFLAKKGAAIHLPPFGILRLDPAADLIFAGAIVLPSTGHDPMAELLFPVHNDQTLVGLDLHVQAINAFTATGRPRLSNAVVTKVIQ